MHAYEIQTSITPLVLKERYGWDIDHVDEAYHNNDVYIIIRNENHASVHAWLMEDAIAKDMSECGGKEELWDMIRDLKDRGEIVSLLKWEFE
jgi:hypothetical protein